MPNGFNIEMYLFQEKHNTHYKGTTNISIHVHYKIEKILGIYI